MAGTIAAGGPLAAALASRLAAWVGEGGFGVVGIAGGEFSMEGVAFAAKGAADKDGLAAIDGLPDLTARQKTRPWFYVPGFTTAKTCGTIYTGCDCPPFQVGCQERGRRAVGSVPC